MRIDTNAANEKGLTVIKIYCIKEVREEIK